MRVRPRPAGDRADPRADAQHGAAARRAAALGGAREPALRRDRADHPVPDRANRVGHRDEAGGPPPADRGGRNAATRDGAMVARASLCDRLHLPRCDRARPRRQVRGVPLGARRLTASATGEIPPWL